MKDKTMESLPYQSHSETSKEAAGLKRTAKADRLIISQMIINQGINGLTNDEISERKGKNSSFYSPRLIELERQGAIVKLKQTRKTRYNRNANVYVFHNHVAGREIIPVKKEGKMPDPMIEEADKHTLREFIRGLYQLNSQFVHHNDPVYNAIKRLAGV